MIAHDLSNYPVRCWTFNFPEMTQGILDDRPDLPPACVIPVAVEFILLRRDPDLWILIHIIPLQSNIDYVRKQ